MYLRRNWDQLGNFGRRWDLLRFNQRKPQLWEEYWADQRAYWHADSEDKRRVQLYFDTKDTEANLLAKSRKGYADYCEHLTKWNGLCKSGDTVDVIRTQSDTIVLSMQRHDGRIRDHLDVEIEFGEERGFLFLRKRYCCEIFTYGTITILPGSVEAQMGERIGSSRIRHRHGGSRDRVETVTFDDAQRLVSIDDAAFRVVG